MQEKKSKRRKDCGLTDRHMINSHKISGAAALPCNENPTPITSDSGSLLVIDIICRGAPNDPLTATFL